jgi:two-component system, chemotaxis family, chemotaxis protein CheY
VFYYPLKSSLRSLAPRLSRVEVLLVDPDAEIAELVKNVLEFVGFERVHVKRSASQALKLMREQEIDLIITDWQMMPEKNMNFVQYLRSHDETPNPYIPIIMMTGRAGRQDVEAARDMGVTEFLVKPFTPKRLFEKLVMVIENPRSFIMSSTYSGPDRRRRTDLPPQGQDRRNVIPIKDDE